MFLSCGGSGADTGGGRMMSVRLTVTFTRIAPLSTLTKASSKHPTHGSMFVPLAPGRPCVPLAPGRPCVPLAPGRPCVPLAPGRPIGPCGPCGPCIPVLLFLLSFLSLSNLDVYKIRQNLQRSPQMDLFYIHIFCHLLDIGYNNYSLYRHRILVPLLHYYYY